MPGKTNTMLHVPSKDSDQPEQMPRLIIVLAARMKQLQAIRFSLYEGENSDQTGFLSSLFQVFIG